MKLTAHPLALIFPAMTNDELKELVQDIKKHGLRTPILLYEGKILDGRHRYQACMIAGVEPKTQEYQGDDPVGVVISANLKRRSLTTSQRAMVAAKLANLPPHRPGNKCLNSGTSQAEAAETLGISRNSVQVAAKIAKKDPALAKKVDENKITLHAAKKQLAAANTAKWAAKKTESVEAVRVDAIGRAIPHQIIEDWDRAARVAHHLRSMASEIKCTIENGFKEKDVIFNEIDDTLAGEASAIHYRLSQVVPYSVCPQCQGMVRKDCQLCRKRGWISKYLYQSPVVTKETRALLEKSALRNVV